MLIVDAGGGTVDLSSYSRLSGSGGYTESSIPECAATIIFTFFHRLNVD